MSKIVKLVEVIPIAEVGHRTHLGLGEHLCLREPFQEREGYRLERCKDWAAAFDLDTSDRIDRIEKSPHGGDTFQAVDAASVVVFYLDLYQPQVEDLEAEILTMSEASQDVIARTVKLISDIAEVATERDRLASELEQARAEQLDRAAVEILRGSAHFAAKEVLLNAEFVAAMHRVDGWLARTEQNR